MDKLPSGSGAGGRMALVELALSRLTDLDAGLVPERGAVDPTRCVLTRSPANLTIHAGLFREAEQMAALGLPGSPPDAIADELREASGRAEQMENPEKVAHREPQ